MMVFEDKEILNSRSRNRLEKYGFCKEGLGWGKLPQKVRFKALLKPFHMKDDPSILDVGCGFADLYDYLKESGWNGKYTGLDISPDIINLTKERKPFLDLREIDILEHNFIESYDIVIGCGIFNYNLKNTDQYEYINNMLLKMFKLSKIGLSIDFQSELADIKNENAFYAQFEKILSIASKISKRFSLNHDYAPFEYSLTLLKNQSIEEDLYFSAGINR